MKSEMNFYFLKTFSGTCSVFVFSDHYIVSLFSLHFRLGICLGLAETGNWDFKQTSRLHTPFLNIYK